MKALSWLILGVSVWLVAGCVYPVTLRSRDGITLTGNYQLARQHTGTIRLVSPSGEVFQGTFAAMARSEFVARYEDSFGRGTVAVANLDVSAYGNAFGSRSASAHALVESAHGEIFKDGGHVRVAVSGPLVYWAAALKGTQGTTLICYFIGSQYTGGGFGRCRDDRSQEYTAEF